MLKRTESVISAKGLRGNFLRNIRDHAARRGLVGIAFTREDGSNKIIAEGEEENLINFTKDLNKGNFSHPIEHFYVKGMNSTGEFQDFKVKEKK